MSGPWTILQSSKTSDTAYTIAAAQTDANPPAVVVLTAAQADPTIDPPTDNATTIAFNTEGYGSGVTISYGLAAGALQTVVVVLDGNNDVNTDNTLWFPTDASHSANAPPSGTYYVSTSNTFRSVRLRVESTTGVFAVTNIKLMANS